MQNIYIDNLKPGMIIQHDIYSTKNQLIICKDTIATENIIRRLKYFDIKIIPIYDEDEIVITKEETFQLFKKNYTNLEIEVDDFLNKIIRKEYSKKQMEDIVNSAFELYNTQSSAMIILKMLQQLKNNDIIFAHSLNVGMIGMILAKWCNKSEDEMQLILQAGIFHDVGKMLMPNALLNKATNLTKNEFAELKSHTVEGYNLLKSLEIDERITNVALLHHERIDGSGYPLQLKNAQINKFSNISKIIAIADSYDAMTSKRLYRDAKCPFSVFTIFEQEGISIYDPEYLITFLKNAVNAYVGDNVLLSDGRKGKIILINNTTLGRPIIQIDDEYIDLAKYKESELSIKEILF